MAVNRSSTQGDNISRSPEQFKKTIRAALSETKSKFALAEALAAEIPSRGRGGRAANENVVRDELVQARQAIIAAGGEPRSVETLDSYRRTALWVRKVQANSPELSWLPGVSFSAHNEARKAGMTQAAFARMPDKSVDAVRRITGRAGTDGPATKIAASWTPKQQAEVVTSLAKKPEVAKAIANDPVAQQTTQSAIWAANKARMDQERVDRQQARAAREAAAPEEPEEDLPLPTQSLPHMMRGMEVIGGLAVAHQRVVQAMATCREVGISDEWRDDVLMHIERIEEAVGELKTLALTGNQEHFDTALAAILNQTEG